MKISKLKTVLLMFGLAPLMVTNSKAQASELTVNQRNKPLREVIQVIEKTSDYVFFFNNRDVDLNRRVTVQTKGEPVEKALDQMFSGSKNGYRIDGRQIYVTVKAEAKPAEVLTAAQSPEPQQPPGISITGTVTDDNGAPLPGVNVVLKGSTTGTVTNAEGKYTIAVPNEEAVLSFSFVGYEPQEIVVGQDVNIAVSLKEGQQIEEVVVVGYGSVKKSDLTGSVASVKMKTIADIPANSIDALLQGRAAGLQVMNTSQDPGAGSVIRIRGNSSLRGSNTPLVVVNGFPLGDAGNLSQINPNNIESMEVLKDASAAAIYGSRGANGVILITTKAAREGVTTVSVKHQTVISQLTDKVDIWYDPMLMAQVANEEQINAGLTPPYIGQTIGGIYYPSLLEIQEGKWAHTDWVDVCLRTPIVNSTTLAINSAGERASFNMNVNYWDDEGIYKEDNFRKLNGDVRLSYKLFKDFTLSSYTVFSLGWRNITAGLEYGRNPLWPIYDQNGDYFRAGPQDFGHPLIALRDITNKSTDKEFIESLSADWDIVKGLKLHSQLNYRYKGTVGDVYRASTTSQEAFDNKGIGQVNTTVFQSLLSETWLTWNVTLADRHSLTVMAGHSYGWDNNRGLYTTARGFVNDVLANENMNASDPAKRDIYNNGYYVSRLLSYYGRLNYTLMDRYLFTLTMRADGSTKFGKNNKWGYFPSGAVSWKMHNESFLKDVSWLSELKLRVSYGISGNQGISSYQTLDQYGMEKFWSGGVWNTAVGPGYEVGRTGADNRYMVWGGISNPDLKWETTAQTDVGLDAAFFKNRLRLTFDTYDKRTHDLLREKYLPLSSSYDKLWVNDGEVTNQGFEISIEGDIMSTEDWGFTLGMNISVNRNKVTDMGDAVSSGLSTDIRTGMFYEVTGSPISMFNQNASIYGIGQPMNVFYGYRVDGIIQQGQDPGFIDPDAQKDRAGELKYLDLTGDYAITAADRTVIGDPNPKFTGGLNASLRWKKLDFSVLLYGVYGNDVLFNSYTFMPRVKARRWTPDNPTNDYPRLNNNRQYWLSDYFLMDGSFLRIQNVNIGYRFDVDKIIKSFRVFFNIENLFTFTTFDGYDPEVGLDGIYWGGYPKFRKFTLGLDLKF